MGKSETEVMTEKNESNKDTDHAEDFHKSVQDAVGDYKEEHNEDTSHDSDSHSESTNHDDPSYVNESLDKLLEIEAIPVADWEEVHSSEFIKIYKKKDESPVVMIKCYASFPGLSPEKVQKLIHNLEVRKEWDNVLSDLKSFDKVNDHIDHMYSLYKAPIGISNRDFCQRRLNVKDYKGVPYVIHFKSVKHPDCPKKSGIVRANTHISGYVIRPSKKYEGGTDMTILTQTDIKGMIPKMIVNMAAAKAPASWCQNFQKQGERLSKEGKI